MSRINKIAENIAELLPDNSSLIGTDGMETRKQLIQQKAENIQASRTARELAKAKYLIKIGHQAESAKKAVAEYKHKKEEAKEQAIKQLEEEADIVTAEEAIEIGNEVAVSNGQPPIDLASQTAKAILASQGTTRPEIVRLLTQLNVNLNLQLTKTDTANLLACLLTANENQLKAIYKNKKVPLAIKTVIKRMIDDSMLGNIETVEKLWDRIFGKTGMMLNLPEQTQQMTGIIPNTPVSREAYIVIRDTLLK